MMKRILFYLIIGIGLLTSCSSESYNNGDLDGFWVLSGRPGLTWSFQGKILEFRDVNEELLKGYQDNFDFNELGKLAIDYSDGIIQASAGTDQELIDYAKEKNIPLLGYKEDFADAYETFYEQLFPEE